MLINEVNVCILIRVFHDWENLMDAPKDEQLILDHRFEQHSIHDLYSCRFGLPAILQLRIVVWFYVMGCFQSVIDEIFHVPKST